LHETENARGYKIVASPEKANCKEWDLDGNGICKEWKLQRNKFVRNAIFIKLNVQENRPAREV